jgi:hypothetical protein
MKIFQSFSFATSNRNKKYQIKRHLADNRAAVDLETFYDVTDAVIVVSLSVGRKYTKALETTVL